MMQLFLFSIVAVVFVIYFFKESESDQHNGSNRSSSSPPSDHKRSDSGPRSGGNNRDDTLKYKDPGDRSSEDKNNGDPKLPYHRPKPPSKNTNGTQQFDDDNTDSKTETYPRERKMAETIECTTLLLPNGMTKVTLPCKHYYYVPPEAKHEMFTSCKACGID